MKCQGVLAGFLISTSLTLSANPTGGTVTSGAATINPLAGKTLTIDQTSRSAIIDWNTFSIASGETTKFVQPNSSSAVLNRVTGGGTSIIDGTLTANGQVFLINGNGILVSKTGKVSTAGFTASTLDIADSDFLAGNDHFTGSSAASVQNLGVISASNGNIYLIAQQVSNAGALSAPKGTVGLAAGTDIVVAQKNADGSTITVNPSSVAAAVNGTGVSNAGKIAAAAAELRAANGNIYSLAINNTGSVRATGVSRKGGRIWLVAGSGTVQTSGTLATSAAGTIVTNGGSIGASGTVDSGKGGHWTIDPSDVVISNSQPNGGAPELNATTLGKDLTAGSDEMITAVGGDTDTGNIDVESPITWTSDANLILNAPGNINLNAAITGAKGGILVNPTGYAFATGNVSVASFELEDGTWSQIVGQNLAKLPTFSAPAAFTIDTNATFARFAGGDGGDIPFQVVDIYGLEGIGSGPTSTRLLQLDNYIVKSAISGTAVHWNFTPIAAFGGTFNGNKLAITGLHIVAGSSGRGGLFMETDAGSVIENVNLTNVFVGGMNDTGGVASINNGAITNCSVTGTITNSTPTSADFIDFGGIAGQNTGVISNCTTNLVISLPVSAASFSTQENGGLVGLNSPTGLISSCSTAGKITIQGLTSVGANNSLANIGGLAGTNEGTIENCTNKATLNLDTQIVFDVGGLVGDNFDIVINSTNSGAITCGAANDIGGIVGEESASTSYVSGCTNSGAITLSGPGSSSGIGGILGADLGSTDLTSCANTGAISVASTGTISGVGGVVGTDLGGGMTLTNSIRNSSNSGQITLNGIGEEAGGIAGVLNRSSGEILGCQNTGGIKITDSGTGWTRVGGIAGYFSGTAMESCSSNAAISVATGGMDIGGLVGIANTRNLVGCSSAGSLTVGKLAQDDGGLVGEDTTGTTISQCTSAVALTVNGDLGAFGPQSIAGLVGLNAGTLEASANMGAVNLKATVAGSQSYEAIGGVAGQSTGSIQSCSNSGAVTVGGTGVQAVGGIVGLDTNAALIASCANSGAVNVPSANGEIGGVVGAVQPPQGEITQLYSVSNSGAITVGTFAAFVGGVAGEGADSNVTYASNTGPVKANAYYIGGIFGDFSGTGQLISNTGAVTAGANAAFVGGVVGQFSGTLNVCYNTGAVTAGANSEGIGGVAGTVITNGTLVNSYSTGSVAASGANSSQVGGFIGANDAVILGSIAGDYSTGKVSATGMNIGGFVGLSTNVQSVEECYWNEQTSGQTSSAGGTGVATTALMDTQGTYVDFDFIGTWGIYPNSTPYLLSFQAPHSSSP